MSLTSHPPPFEALARSSLAPFADKTSADPASTIPATSNWGLILRMLGLGWKYRWGCVQLLLLQGLVLGAGLVCLRLTGLGIDLIRHHADPAHVPPPLLPWGLAVAAAWRPLAQVGLVAALILLFELIRGGLNYRYALRAANLIHTRIVVDLRSRVYDKLQRLSFQFFDGNATGSIINRVTADVQSVRAFIDGVLIQLVLLCVSLVCYLATMLSIHARLTLACLATTPMIWLLTVVFSRIVRPLYDRNRELIDRVILRLSENIQGVQVIKGFGREQEEIARFGRDNREVQDQQRGIFWRVSIFGPLVGWLTQINLVILLAYGGSLVAYEGLPLGSGLIVFAGLLQQFSSQVANLTNLANSVQQSLSGARRVFEILDAPIAIQSPAEPERLPRARGEVRFESVSFAYQPGNLALQELEFTVSPGQRVAILGATGAGKSTLLSLICRFYDPTRGRILIDGHDLRRFDLDDLRRNIGIVFQESFLFSNTVAANIAFGHPEATLAQVEAAARIAAAHDFITALPNGYDTVLGEGGLDLSGGQRQRLAIARAVLLNPAILLLDDPAAAIDAHTEQEILDAMQQAMHGRTTFVVAHRLSTLRKCNHVIVLEAGRIVQSGSHADLMRQAGHYRLAAESQIGLKD